MERNVKLKIKTGVSSKTNKEYIRCYIDLGYREYNVTFNTAEIAELFGLSVLGLYEIIDNQKKEVK